MTLTDSEIEELAQVIITKHMASIALKDLGLPHETVENLKLIRQGDYIALNRDILILWRNKNPGINQVQVSKKIATSSVIQFIPLISNELLSNSYQVYSRVFNQVSNEFTNRKTKTSNSLQIKYSRFRLNNRYIVTALTPVPVRTCSLFVTILTGWN